MKMKAKLIFVVATFGMINTMSSVASAAIETTATTKALTASSHSTNTLDMETTEKIRRQLMGYGTLSMSAKNIQILTQDGRVSLKGMVTTESERQTVERVAKKIAGEDKVVNETTVTK